MASQEAQTMKHKIAMLVVIAGIFVTSGTLSGRSRYAGSGEECGGALPVGRPQTGALGFFGEEAAVRRSRALPSLHRTRPSHFRTRSLSPVRGHLGRLSERRRGQAAWGCHHGCGVEARWRLGAVHDDQSDKRKDGAEDNVRAESGR
jgi:hypothetical protein